MIFTAKLQPIRRHLYKVGARRRSQIRYGASAISDLREFTGIEPVVHQRRDLSCDDQELLGGSLESALSHALRGAIREKVFTLFPTGSSCMAQDDRPVFEELCKL